MGQFTRDKSAIPKEIVFRNISNDAPNQAIALTLETNRDLRRT
jgi:hypothetical protein